MDLFGRDFSRSNDSVNNGLPDPSRNFNLEGEYARDQNLIYLNKHWRCNCREFQDQCRSHDGDRLTHSPEHKDYCQRNRGIDYG